MINELIIPNSTAFIGEMAFYECNGFDKLTINSERIMIQDKAFDLTHFSVVTYSGTREP